MITPNWLPVGLLTGDEWACLPEIRFLTEGVCFHLRI
jgi:hypothetical protein